MIIFIVLKDGSVNYRHGVIIRDTNHVEESISYIESEEKKELRKILRSSPAWRPAILNGRNVF